MSIDYGNGTTNVDTATGIRYGVINQSELSEFAMEDILENGVDLDWKEFRKSTIDSIAAAIAEAVDEAGGNDNDFQAEATEIFEEQTFDNFESGGDFTRYRYEADGYIIETHSRGDWFVMKSPYYTSCGFCSPCAPGAGDLTSAGGVKAYCLGDEWFSDNNPCPYTVYTV